ncbi:MAG: hypothetical protein H7Z11_01810 [Verrucomicrobia bacterium]|nr:hypothetical protein [Leptolyngbya sp. ES-bin-22]
MATLVTFGSVAITPLLLDPPSCQRDRLSAAGAKVSTALSVSTLHYCGCGLASGNAACEGAKHHQKRPGR